MALVKLAALDLGSSGVRANAVTSGMFRTRANDIPEAPVAEPEYLEGVPLGRFAEPFEMAAVVAFLASDDASCVSGELLVADGGTIIGVRLPLPDAPLPVSARSAEMVIPLHETRKRDRYGANVRHVSQRLSE